LNLENIVTTIALANQRAESIAVQHNSNHTRRRNLFHERFLAKQLKKSRGMMMMKVITEVATGRCLASGVTMSHKDGSDVGSLAVGGAGGNKAVPSCERFAVGYRQICTPTQKTINETRVRIPKKIPRATAKALMFN
jgi:hypothetical protein